MFSKILSVLFPPKLGRVDDVRGTMQYWYRTSRRGVYNHPKMSWGRIAAPAQEKRIFHLPGRMI